MKKHLPLLLSGVLALSTAQQATARPLGLAANRHATKNTSAAPASVKLVDMDLTSYGMPLLIQVPTGTTAVAGKLGGVKLTATDFALELDESSAKYEPAAQALEYRKTSDITEGGSYTVGVEEPLAFRAHSTSPETADDDFLVIVENPGANKYYTISLTPKGLFSTYGAAAVETMYTSARSARLTPAAKAVKAFVAVAPKAAVRNAAGETDLSAFGMPVLIKVPAGTTVAMPDPGKVELNSPDFGVRVTTENDAAKLRANTAEAKQMLQKMGYTLVVNEPLAISAKPKKVGEDNLWMVMLPDAATGKAYSFESTSGMGKSKQYGAVKTQAMFAAAKAAKLKK